MRLPNVSAHLQQNAHLRVPSVPSREYNFQPSQPTVLREDRPRKKQRTARTLLVDNYDSYTYNLFQLISKVTGGETWSLSIAIFHDRAWQAYLSVVELQLQMSQTARPLNN